MVVLSAFAFFLSGFAALLYQVVWQRLLAIFAGADVNSVTLIVAAFMAGLGAGNLAGGVVADRVSRRAALALFAAAELAIAVFGCFSSRLFYDGLYQRLGHLAIPSPAVAVILFTTLLWPTFFMGASLPLLARTLTGRIEHAASTIGILYGVNTLGAAAGAFVSTWALLPYLGLDRSVRIGALLNLACAALLVPAVSLLERRNVTTPQVSRPQPPSAEGSAGPAPRFSEWVMASALAGFVSLSLEIVWFRLLGVMVKSSAFTFGTLLAVHLFGIGFGSLAGSVMARGFRRPARAFFGLQAGAVLIAAALLSLFVEVIAVRYRPVRYFSQGNPMDVAENIRLLGMFARGLPNLREIDLPAEFLALYLALPAMLVLPSTLFMGLSFPALQRVAQTDLAHLGRRVGVLLLANVVGSVAGTIVTGLVLLDLLGSAGTLKLLTALGGLLLWPALTMTFREYAPKRVDQAGGPRGAAGLVAAAIALPLMVALPDGPALWKRLHGTESPLIVREDGSGVSAIRIDGVDRATVYANGLQQSDLPYGDIHTALGAIPAFLHAAPRSALVIGLGSGATVYAVASRRDLAQITCIEIVGPQAETLRALNLRFDYPGLRGLLGDDRIESIVGDGRVHLMRSGRTYDLIEADALRPGSALSGMLYSEEYFTLVRDRLNVNGLATTWAPTPRVFNSFVRVFPYVVQLPQILIGSRQPIHVDRALVAHRLAESRAREYFAAAGVDIERVVAAYLAAPLTLGSSFPRQAMTDVNTDLFPRDEYDLAD